MPPGAPGGKLVVMSDRNGTPVTPEDAAAALASLIGSGWQWWWSVVNELQHLPEVLRQMRDGAENFEQVSRQLANSTATFEQLVELYGKTLLDAAERNAAMTEAMRQRIEGLAGFDAADSAADAAAEIQKMFGALAQFNPLLRGLTSIEPDDKAD